MRASAADITLRTTHWAPRAALDALQKRSNGRRRLSAPGLTPPPPPAMGSHMLGLPLQIGPASSERRGSPSPPQSDQRKSSGARGVTSFSFHVDPPSRSEPAPIKPSLVRCQWRFFFPHSLRCLSLVIPHRHFCLFVPPATQFGKSFHHGREQGLGQDLRVRH